MTEAQKRQQLIMMFGTYSQRMEKLYDDFILKLSALAIKSHKSVKSMLEESPLYHFSDYPELQTELNSIFSDYLRDSMLCYRAGITSGVALAFSHDAGVLKGFSVLSDKAISQVRETASETFLRTRLNAPKGLNLSQLVWNYTSQAKSEFEVAIANVLADGLKGGYSAADLARQARQYLNAPDMMYRRYHRTVVDAQGNKKDIVRWRRRVIDAQGKVRFIEEPIEKVGMGHYRSARKNSERLMRTEINGAYHHANYERWQLEPFIIGIQIDLSPQHTEPDMCDELKGRYPKDFLFAGWHPQCLCMSNPITIQGEEKKEFYRRLAAGEDMSNYVSPNRVKDVPKGFHDYVDKMHDKMVSAGERGTLGYVWQDNKKYWRGQFSREEQEKMGVLPELHKRVKTEAEKAAIQKRWDERKAKNALIIKTGKNVWSVADNLEYIETIQAKASLRDAILMGDTVRTAQLSKELAKQIAGINRTAAQYGEYIPNIKTHLKSLTVDELTPVYDGIVNKIGFLEKKYAGDLAEQAKKYLWEAQDYLGGNMYGVQQKYPKTWKVSQEAYYALAEKTRIAYEWSEVVKGIEELKAFTTNSPIIKSFIKDLDILSASKQDLAKTQEILSQANKKKQALIREAELRARKKGGGSGSNSLYDGGVSPFTAEELAKLKDYEDKILDAIFSGKRTTVRLMNAEYHDYVLSLSEKYYDKQVSQFTAAEQKAMKKATEEYLKRTPSNPHYIWGSNLGGVYVDTGTQYKLADYLPKLKGLTEEELSIVKRFTNGSTFSNTYNLRGSSSYWKNKWEQKMRDYCYSQAERDFQEKIIEEWSQSANYTLDRMVRYNGITFRGLDSGGGPELRAALTKAFNTGQPWVNEASCSTSMRLGVAEGFDGDVILVIHNKTGAYIHAISDYSTEYEIMTLRGAKYRVIKAPVEIKGTWYCELEEIV